MPLMHLGDYLYSHYSKLGRIWTMVEAKKDVKTTAKQAEETVKPAAAKAEAKQAEPVKEAAVATASDAVKAPAKKAAAAKKAPARKAAAPAAKKETAAAAKKETASAAKKETEKKAPAKTAAAKKPAAKKAEPKAAVHFQFDGKDLVAKDVLDQAIKAFKHTHRGVEIKNIELYIVANEGAAYYVVNGEANDEYKIML